MRAIVGREGLDHAAASSSQIGRFESVWLTIDTNLEILRDMSGAWFDRFHHRRKARSGTVTSAAPVTTRRSRSNAAEMRRGDARAVLRNREARSGSCSPAFRDSR
jgi:hypothetical protein